MAQGTNVATSIDTFLKGYGSPLAGHGSTFVAAGRKYGVDPRLVVAISGAESSFGKHILGDFNAWGWGPGRPFGSWEEGISTVTRGLHQGYISQGRLTPAQIVSKYAPASDGNDEAHWSGLVSQFMRELGVSPAATTATKVVQARKTSAVPTSDLSSFLTPALPSTSGLEFVARQTLGSIAAHGRVNPMDMLSGLVAGRLQDVSTDAANRRQMDELRAAIEKSGEPSTPASPEPAAPRAVSDFKPGLPIPAKDLRRIGAEHPTSGLDGFPAHDYFANAGSPVLAPISGTIFRFSGHPPSEGPPSGVHGPFGWSIYLRGDDGRTYYLTHLGSRSVSDGQKVSAGDEIGTVGDYAHWGGSNHVHMGVSG